ncbi:hypothetical protein [Thermococcus sp. 21S9]|nr:hypothetical protein [Thermococcus sp. 21S9]
MFEVKELKEKTIDEYSSIVGGNVIEMIKRKAEKLEGSSIANVNSTA